MELPQIHAPHGGPLVGVMMTAVGAAGWCYSTMAHWIAADPVGPMMAQAAPAAAEAAGQWASTGQAVSGALAIVGGVMTWISLQRANVNQARRSEEAKDADAERDRTTKDALARIEVQMAELKLEQLRARTHVETLANSLPPTDGPK